MIAGRSRAGTRGLRLAAGLRYTVLEGPARGEGDVPFGLFFAAIYFALFCSVFGLRCALWPQSLARPTGVFILTCSLALAVGLFGRRRWARWLALTAAALLAPIALLAFYDQGGLLELIWMLGNLLVVMLLALPATGRDPRSVEPSLSLIHI